jgi:F1F0 ATPase subunit 2
MLVRLEMDKECMSSTLFSALPSWAKLLALAIHLPAGIALGVIFFQSLWWNVRRFTHGGRLVTTIALTISRFLPLAGLLTLTSLEGALPLLMLSLGVFVGRSVVMSRVREAAP